MITAWLAITVAAVASTIIGSSSASRNQAVERILDRRRIGQHHRALAEIIDQQRRQHEAEPGGLDRLAAEMAEIGIERLAAGDGQKHRAERDQADVAVIEQKLDAVERIDGGEHRGSSRMCIAPAIAIATNQTTMTGPNKAATLAVPRRCAANSTIRMSDGERHHVVLNAGRRELQALRPPTAPRSPA